MLANGAKLGYKAEKGAAAYTDLPGLKEIPDWGSDPEKVDNSALTDPYKQYEMGIGELGDVKYKFKYDNSKADTPYRILKALSDSKEVGFFFLIGSLINLVIFLDILNSRKRCPVGRVLIRDILEYFSQRRIDLVFHIFHFFFFTASSKILSISCSLFFNAGYMYGCAAWPEQR